MMNIASIRIFSLFAIILTLCSTSGVQAVEDKQTGTLPAVIMLLDSDATAPSCGGAQIEAVMGQCSSGVPITVTITTKDGSTRRIDSVPTLSIMPILNDWEPSGNTPVPAEITDTQAYIILLRGSVFNETICSTPATAPPNNGGVPLTSMVIKTTTTCLSDGSTETLEVDILPML
jgi:hypothetical protein